MDDGETTVIRHLTASHKLKLSEIKRWCSICFEELSIKVSLHACLADIRLVAPDSASADVFQFACRWCEFSAPSVKALKNHARIHKRAEVRARNAARNSSQASTSEESGRVVLTSYRDLGDQELDSQVIEVTISNESADSDSLAGTPADIDVPDVNAPHFHKPIMHPRLKRGMVVKTLDCSFLMIRMSPLPLLSLSRNSQTSTDPAQPGTLPCSRTS